MMNRAASALVLSAKLIFNWHITAIFLAVIDFKIVLVISRLLSSC